MNNELNTHVSEIDLGAITADADVFGLFLPKKSKILGFYVKDGAGIAASDTNYFILKLMNGSTELGAYDTRAAGQGALTANTPKAGVLTAALVAMGGIVVPAGSYLKANYNEEGTIAMTAGKLIVHWHPL